MDGTEFRHIDTTPLDIIRVAGPRWRRRIEKPIAAHLHDANSCGVDAAAAGITSLKHWRCELTASGWRHSWSPWRRQRVCARGSLGSGLMRPWAGEMRVGEACRRQNNRHHAVTADRWISGGFS
jgi:hypothetical protein